MDSGTEDDLSAVWGTGTDDVWVIGLQGSVFHWDGATLSDRSADVPVSGYLFDISGASADEIWIVGRGEGEEGIVLRWDGNTFSAQNSGTPRQLNGVWAGGQETWAVGWIAILHHARR
jgi:hypothetical protein